MTEMGRTNWSQLDDVRRRAEFNEKLLMALLFMVLKSGGGEEVRISNELLGGAQLFDFEVVGQSDGLVIRRGGKFASR